MKNATEIAGYKILSKIGSGAASDLYAVQDQKSKQVWALKYVGKKTDRDHRFIEQVEAEYDIGTKLNHPNIRGVEKMVKHRKRFKVAGVSLIMELVDAQPLDARLPSNQLEAVKIFIQIAQGLAHMHSRGYVHADMKPSNVLIDPHGPVKIIDLGQCCKIGTVKQRIQGTPGYMAPEQAHRQAITPKTDIYNFGATMYWVLVQEVIPTAMPPKDVHENSLYSGAVDTGMVKPPMPPDQKRSDIHPLLSKQIMDCVQLDPHDRPESMQVVINRLELIQDLLEQDPEDALPMIDDDTHVEFNPNEATDH